MWVVQRWFGPAPARRLGLLRILVGGVALAYVAVRTPHLVAFGDFARSRFDPAGVVSVMLDAPLPAAAVTLTVLATLIAGIAFVLGWRFRVSGPAFALLLLWVTTYRNSWGLVLHTENLMVLHVLVLGFVRAADAHSLDARRERRPDTTGEPYGWPIRLLVLVTVLTYFVSGWAKLRNGGLDWSFGDILRNQIAYDNLRKLQLGDVYSPVGGWLAANAGWVFPPMATLSLALELGAPVAVVGGRVGRLFAGAAWSFHFGIVVLMAIVFPYQLFFVAFAPFFEVERGFDRVLSWLRRRRARAPAVSPGSG